MKAIVRVGAVVAALTAMPCAVAQQAVPSPVEESVPVAPGPLPGYVRVPAGLAVEIEITEPISSKTAKIDGEFPIRLAAPIVLDGVTIVPAGAVGNGQIVHAAKARALGKAGELILAARRVSCGGTTVALRSFRYSARGKDNSGTIVAVTAAAGLVATPLMFLSGGEVVVPAGTHAFAKVKEAIDLPASGAATCVMAPATQ